MSKKPDVAERIGRAVNELDIDFSAFTLAGWGVIVLTLCLASGAAGLVAYWMIQRNGLNTGVGLIFFVVFIGTATMSFLGLRWLLKQLGVSITRSVH